MPAETERSIKQYTVCDDERVTPLGTVNPLQVPLAQWSFLDNKTSANDKIYDDMCFGRYPISSNVAEPGYGGIFNYALGTVTLPVGYTIYRVFDERPENMPAKVAHWLRRHGNHTEAFPGAAEEENKTAKGCGYFWSSASTLEGVAQSEYLSSVGVCPY